MNIKVNYKSKKIQDIKTGEMVVSFDVDNAKFRHNFVSATHLPIVEKDRQLQIITDNGTEIVNSIDHPILVLKNFEWVYIKSSELSIGDILKTHNNVTSIVEINKPSVDEQFYDLTVENDNNFLAGNTDDKMIVGHNSATNHFPFWHSEINEILVLKNNKGTDDTRVRKLDYSIQLSRIFYKRFIEDKEITLFSPHEVPGLYEAFCGPADEFEALYEKYERTTSIKKKKVKARDLMNQLVQERIGTGRIYVMNMDHVNKHSAFIDKVYMSNLCVDPDTIINIRIDKKHELDIRIEDLGFIYCYYEEDSIEVLSYNEETNTNEYKLITNFDLTHGNAELLEITDEETGKSFKCTANHKVYTKNRGYVMAGELKETDELVISDLVTNVTSKTDIYEKEDISNEETHSLYDNN